MVLVADHDHRPWTSTSILGLSFWRPRQEEEKILSDLQRVQARALSPLLDMQLMCLEYGPSLPLDQQLHRILQSEILRLAVVL